MAVASRRRHCGTAGSVGSNRLVAGHLSSHRTFSSRHLSGAAPIYEQGGGGRERPPASAAPPVSYPGRGGRPAGRERCARVFVSGAGSLNSEIDSLQPPLPVSFPLISKNPRAEMATRGQTCPVPVLIWPAVTGESVPAGGEMEYVHVFHRIPKIAQNGRIPYKIFFAPRIQHAFTRPDVDRLACRTQLLIG